MNINKNQEKDHWNVLAILKKADYGVINQIIITVEDPEIFQVGPWEWDFIDFNFLPGETDSFNYYVHEYQTEQGTVNVSSKVAYLSLVYAKNEEPMEGVDEWLKGWSLAEYTYNNKSLFCLSSSADPKHEVKRKEKAESSAGKETKKVKEVKRKETTEGKKVKRKVRMVCLICVQHWYSYQRDEKGSFK
ncbi:hypothetical protein ISN44_As09g013830 [Arabidopsis suecica]|uniref:Uncharacterized protein n=1 Tax=Arabidopsis suecica TaxID=45249 RepID=A0A8T2AHN7_ARASU|nr:hypothetical protein ISN44_As09g013830 [Arabidopsis suecica]